MTRSAPKLAFARALLAVGLAVSGFSPGCGKPQGVEIRFDRAKPTESLSEPAVGTGDWPWWRGLTHDGIAAGDATPLKWSESENVVWKQRIPGRGHSSPTVVGPHIFLATADEPAQTQSLLCLDRKTGNQKWRKDLHQGGFPIQVHAQSSHASCTAACDGERVFIAFLNHDRIFATALDLEGKQLWQQNLGPFASTFGYCPSPAIYKSLVIFAADHYQGGFLAAVHRKSGRIVWRKPRPAYATYSSPAIATVADRDQILICGANLVAAYNPESGDEMWSCKGTSISTCGTMAFAGDVVFASGGYPGRETIAVRADGSKQVLWRIPQTAYVPSPLAYKGKLFILDGEGGILFCLDPADGKQRWTKRLKSVLRASPVIAGDKLYVANALGTTYVFQIASETIKPVAENKLGTEMYATPAICGGQIFLRVANGSGSSREEALYCIGQTTPKTAAIR